ncbi:ATP-dependent zinc metalloprotease FTSH, putative [Plasmodium gallinaceum]|uniref:ATP-dependent zinc metalloprotease FTSH, putative n=1 Tax=Plasmodium gallinaceum TaxID=5849 RepID=A0A1J1GVC4_PLAGA|nr:ATP-dependent zinc metalloprotease FTSH, putative [Plasmodium gallinaceum]CRG96244.1 ATP-dependent zinc metalloprotease FTSH, putative [Plasmodium gallinaceum]
MYKLFAIRRNKKFLYNEKNVFHNKWIHNIHKRVELEGNERRYSSICVNSLNKNVKNINKIVICNDNSYKFSLNYFLKLILKWKKRNNFHFENKFMKYIKMNHTNVNKDEKIDYKNIKKNFVNYENIKFFLNNYFLPNSLNDKVKGYFPSGNKLNNKYISFFNKFLDKSKEDIEEILNFLKESKLKKKNISFFGNILYNNKIDKINLFEFLKIYFTKVPKGFERFEDKKSSPNSYKPEDEKNKKFDNYFFYIFFLLLLFFLLFVDSNSLYNEITQNDFFYNYLSKGYVEKIKLINKDYVKAYLNTYGIKKYHLKYVCFRIGNSDSFERKVEEIQKEMNINRDEIIEVQYMNETNILNEIKGYIPSILFFLLLIFLFQKITLKNVTNSGMDKLFKFSKISPINKNNFKTDVKFSNVAGMKQAKEEIMEFVDFLKNPSKYEILGAKIPKGALLCGAPGTGKTLLAKAVAGEANVPFFNISGSDFIEVFVGIGPSRVRELFAQARKHAPSIIFIDEIDAVGRKRSKGGFAGGGNDERENTLNQMLVEMDGFHTSNDKVVVLAGTNRVDILDPAITRPGRFDRIVNISKPDINERSEIFQVHLKNLKLHETLDIKNISYILASLTPGFVGADIANVVNEGAIQCARRSNLLGVQIKDFELAIERVIGGLPKSSSLISPLEKKIISYHETGHALIGWFLEFADPVLKVSIIPRNNGALGYSQHLSEEIMLFSREAILDKIAVILGGRAAEELFIGKITTGAIDDLNKVTQLSYSFVSQYGMNKEIGLVSFQPNSNSEYNLYRPHSECLAHLIDNEVRNLIETQYKRVKSILLKNEQHVHNLANLLYQKETISYHDIVKCVGERPHPIKSNYEKFVKANPYKLIPNETETNVINKNEINKDEIMSENDSENKEKISNENDKCNNNETKRKNDVNNNCDTSEVEIKNEITNPYELNEENNDQDKNDKQMDINKKVNKNKKDNKISNLNIR